MFGTVMSPGETRARFPLLLSPFELRGRPLRNRIVSTPHATGWSHDGSLARSEVDYHVRKAAGGCGLVMTFGSASVDPTTAASYGSVALWDEANEPALRALADGVHEHGALCIAQMTHMGRRGHSKESGIPLRAASDLPEPVHRETGVDLVAMTRALIADPDLPRRLAGGARIRPCISINEGCIGRLYSGLPLWCSVNPAINARVIATRSTPVSRRQRSAAGPSRIRPATSTGTGTAARIAPASSL